MQRNTLATWPPAVISAGRHSNYAQFIVLTYLVILAANTAPATWWRHLKERDKNTRFPENSSYHSELTDEPLNPLNPDVHLNYTKPNFILCLTDSTFGVPYKYQPVRVLLARTGGLFYLHLDKGICLPGQNPYVSSSELAAHQLERPLIPDSCQTRRGTMIIRVGRLGRGVQNPQIM